MRISGSDSYAFLNVLIFLPFITTMVVMIHRCEVPYHASFVSDRSSAEFEVFPQTGVLPPPCDGPGAVITVGFTPHSYGRTCITRLIVQVTALFFLFTPLQLFLIIDSFDAVVR